MTPTCAGGSPQDSTPDLVVDLFAGPGGWSQAAKQLGVREVGIEWDWAACLTRKAAGHMTIRADVAAYPTWPFIGRLWGLIGSPPCTLFSAAGSGLGTRVMSVLAWAIAAILRGEDVREQAREAVYPTALAEQEARNVKRKPEKKWPRERVEAAARHDAFICCLVLEPARWIYDTRPEWVALEQVPAVLPLWRMYATHMRPLGYSVYAVELNAADYGVPQTRVRAILGASLTQQVAPPEPTHCKGGSPADLFGESLAEWVSMAEALDWGATDRPCPTVTAGGTSTGGAEPLARGGRAALAESKRGGLGCERLPAGAWRGDARTPRRAPRHACHGPCSGHHVEGAHGHVDGDRMTGCPCGGGHPLWRNGNQPNSAERYACQPAPTVHFGHRSNDVRWVVDRRTNSKGPGHREGAPMVPTAPVPITEPAPTLTAKAGGQWVIRPDWAYERPATTVVGSFCPDVIAAPGYRTSESRQNAEASIKVTVAEASILQSFPADYPWQGSRTKQFEQVGNAIPPGLAAHVLSSVTGIALPTEADRDVA